MIEPEFLSDITAEKISTWLRALQQRGLAVTTVRVHGTLLRAALNWSEDLELIAAVPKFRLPPDRKGPKAKGRAIATEEFERILSQVDKLVRKPYRAQWKRFLWGLWWSGLRLGEALALSWDAASPISVSFDAQGRAFLQFEAGAQKSGRAEIVPAAPEFAELLAQTPNDKRHGRVFRMQTSKRYEGIHQTQVSDTISKLGKAAGVVVNPKTKKCATAHDFRRSFGTRWAKRVMPVTLKALMRHARIETTMEYYVTIAPTNLAADLWAIHQAEGGNKTATQYDMDERQGRPEVA